ncbi:hypothetical protein INR49_007103 [Caranx melampygus]|nr:hypothetical protein INR49_007103 [Caranx melampygus]
MVMATMKVYLLIWVLAATLMLSRGSSTCDDKDTKMDDEDSMFFGSGEADENESELAHIPGEKKKKKKKKRTGGEKDDKDEGLSADVGSRQHPQRPDTLVQSQRQLPLPHLFSPPPAHVSILKCSFLTVSTIARGRADDKGIPTPTAPTAPTPPEVPGGPSLLNKTENNTSSSTTPAPPPSASTLSGNTTNDLSANNVTGADNESNTTVGGGSGAKTSAATSASTTHASMKDGAGGDVTTVSTTTTGSTVTPDRPAPKDDVITSDLSPPPVSNGTNLQLEEKDSDGENAPDPQPEANGMETSPSSNTSPSSGDDPADKTSDPPSSTDLIFDATGETQQNENNNTHVRHKLCLLEECAKPGDDCRW